jgi:hypothetical protein
VLELVDVSRRYGATVIALLVPLGARMYERSVLRMSKPMKLRETWRAARA